MLRDLPQQQPNNKQNKATASSHKHNTTSPPTPPKKQNDHKFTLRPPRKHRPRQQSKHPGETTAWRHRHNITRLPTLSRALFANRRHDMTANTSKGANSCGRRVYYNLTSLPLPPSHKRKPHQSIKVYSRLRHCRMSKAPLIAPRAHILVKRPIQETLSSDVKETLIWATAWRKLLNPHDLSNHHCASAARNNGVKRQATRRHGSIIIRNPIPSRDLHASALSAFTCWLYSVNH